MCHLVCFRVKFAAVGVGLCGTKIEEIAHAAGQVGNQVGIGQAQALGYQLADVRRGEELPVFILLFLFTVCVVIFKIAPLQPVEAAIAGVGIVDVLPGEIRPLRSTVNEIFSEISGPLRDVRYVI